MDRGDHLFPLLLLNYLLCHRIFPLNSLLLNYLLFALQDCRGLLNLAQKGVRLLNIVAWRFPLSELQLIPLLLSSKITHNHRPILFYRFVVLTFLLIILLWPAFRISPHLLLLWTILNLVLFNNILSTPNGLLMLVTSCRDGSVCSWLPISRLIYAHFIVLFLRILLTALYLLLLYYWGWGHVFCCLVLAYKFLLLCLFPSLKTQISLRLRNMLFLLLRLYNWAFYLHPTE